MMEPLKVETPNIYLELGRGWSDIDAETVPSIFQNVYSETNLSGGLIIPLPFSFLASQPLDGTTSLILEEKYSSINGGVGAWGSEWQQFKTSVGLNQAYFFDNRFRFYLEGKYGLAHGDGKMNFGFGYLPEPQEGWTHGLTALAGAEYCDGKQLCTGFNLGYSRLWSLDQKNDFSSESLTPGVRVTLFWDPLPDTRVIKIKTEYDIYETLKDDLKHLNKQQVQFLLERLEHLLAISEQRGLKKQAAELLQALSDIRKSGVYKENLPVVEHILEHADTILKRDQVFALPLIILFKESSTEIELSSANKREITVGTTANNYNIEYAPDCYGNASLDYFIKSVQTLVNRIAEKKLSDLKISIKIKGYSNDTESVDENRTLANLRQQAVRDYLQGGIPQHRLEQLSLIFDPHVGQTGGLRHLSLDEQSDYKKRMDDRRKSDGFSLPPTVAQFCNYQANMNNISPIVHFRLVPSQELVTELDRVNDHSGGHPSSNNYDSPFYRKTSVEIEIVRVTDNVEHVIKGDELHELLEALLGDRGEGEGEFRMVP
jgi:hypothetical protein